MDESAQASAGRRARRAPGAPSTRVTFVLAALIHAGALAFLLRAQPIHERVVSESKVEIDIDREEMVVPITGEGSGSIAPREGKRAGIGIGIGTGSLASSTDSIGEPIVGGSIDRGSGSVVVTDGDGMSRPFGSIHDGFRSLATNDAPAPDVQTAPDLSEKGTRVLRDPLYERDKGLGLGADGPVIQALESSAQASSAPVNGRAVFDVVVGSDGMVTSLTVSEGGIAWSGVAKDALDAVRGKKARVPAAAKKGVAIKIQLESQVLLASGHSPSTSVDIAGIPIKKGDDKSVKVSVLNPIPKIIMVPMSPDGKVNIPMANFELFSTNVDPTDVDPKPRRVIASKVLEEHML